MRHVVYFDWLKFLVIYGIVVYHTALPFSYSSWLIESRDRSVVLSAFTLFTFMEWLRSSGGRRWIARLAALSHRRGGILVFDGAQPASESG